ncbi:hypothetical protein [Vibrio sp. D431a]|uniref:hypothetical protein n=1 Tax=Vibrio sp. D431a TaxID=2837388 RepID=UPI0025521ECF|nr:hypothetical protein [Vibrio sp. D431a]MDK9789847.1 hypothetical protein [Vibrio sp. D431a]
MTFKVKSKEDLQAFVCDALDSLGIEVTVETMAELLMSVAHRAGEDFDVDLGEMGQVKVRPKLTSTKLDA